MLENPPLSYALLCPALRIIRPSRLGGALLFIVGLSCLAEVRVGMGRSREDFSSFISYDDSPTIADMEYSPLNLRWKRTRCGVPFFEELASERIRRFTNGSKISILDLLKDG